MSTLKTIQKRIAKLENELGGLRLAEAALGGKPTKKANKPAKKVATKVKTKASTKPAKAKAKGGSRRPLEQKHLELVLEAIGQARPATELRKLVGKEGKAFDIRLALRKLKELGCIRGEGEKRLMVWHSTGRSVASALAERAAAKAKAAPAVGPETDNPTVEAPAPVAEA